MTPIGTQLSSPSQLFDPDKFAQIDSAPLQSGFVLAYSISNNTYFQIYANDGTVSGTQVQVNSALTNNQVKIATMLSGKFVVAYGSADGSKIYFKLYDGGGTMLTGEIQGNMYGSHNYLDVVGLKNGGFALVYIRVGKTGVNAGIFDDSGNKIVSDFVVSSKSVTGTTLAAVALSNGGFVIVYNVGSSATGIYMTGYRSDGSALFGGYQLTSVNTSSVQGLNAFDQGGFMILYSDNAGKGIYGQVFNNDGVNAMSETLIQSGGKVISGSAVVTNNGTIALSYMNTSVNSLMIGFLQKNSCDLTDLDYTTAEQQDIIVTIISITAFMLMVVSAISSFLAGTEPLVLWTALTILQQIYFFTFLDINFPTNFKQFIVYFRFSTLIFIPSLLDLIDLPLVSSPAKFQQNDFTGLFIKTTTPIFEFYVGVLIFWIFFKLLSRFSFCKYLKTAIQKSFFLRMWINSIPVFLITGFLQINQFSFSTTEEMASSILACVFVGFAGLSLFIFLIMMRKCKKVKPAALFDDYDNQKAYKKYFLIYDLLRRMTIAAIHVYLYSFPGDQVYVIIVLNAFILGLTIIIRPRKTKLQNVYYILLEMCILAISVCIILLQKEIAIDLTLMGYIMIGFTCFVILLTTLPILYNKLKLLSLCLKSCRRNKNYKKKQQATPYKFNQKA